MMEELDQNVNWDRERRVVIRMSPALYERILDAARESRSQLGEYCVLLLTNAVDREIADQ